MQIQEARLRSRTSIDVAAAVASRATIKSSNLEKSRTAPAAMVDERYPEKAVREPYFKNCPRCRQLPSGATIGQFGVGKLCRFRGHEIKKS
jgi:hypothetical protein